MAARRFVTATTSPFFFFLTSTYNETNTSALFRLFWQHKPSSTAATSLYVGTLMAPLVLTAALCTMRKSYGGDALCWQFDMRYIYTYKQTSPHTPLQHDQLSFLLGIPFNYSSLCASLCPQAFGANLHLRDLTILQ